MPADSPGRLVAEIAPASISQPVTLCVEVQCAEGLDVECFGIPPSEQFDTWAQQTFACANQYRWDRAWRERVGADSDSIEESELCIRLVDAAEGERLNATWRDKHSPTNVLSFEADIVAGQYAPLGDLVLCAPVVAREAAEQGKPGAHHYAHLVVHGVLHLLGFDHLINSEAEVMEAMEAAVLSELGIGNPYE